MIQGDIKQKIELSSSFDSLSQIEKFVDDIFEKYQITEDHYGNILIALTEAVNNAITHGNKLNPKKKVNLNVEKRTKDVYFTIKEKFS